MEIIRKNDSTYIIEDNGVRAFLLIGTGRAALIDTGMSITDIRSMVEGITGKEILLLNTHADRDHIGCNRQFTKVYIGVHELQSYPQEDPKQELVPLFEGDCIDLGERTLEVVDLSGHTPGSIGFYDRNSRVLISGDPIQKNGNVYMFGPKRSLIGYIASLERLNKRKDDFDEIWPSHADLPIDSSNIQKCTEDIKDILKGNCPFAIKEMHGTSVRAYQGKTNIYLCDK
ncbi:MAG: MBL fold metallo-hydrolase [Erysipelotrichaceae bacterium]|nr:MBL fold metallo-hydrolase [Erysipelotrichaceae bacterium]